VCIVCSAGVDIQEVSDKVTFMPIPEPVVVVGGARWSGVENDNVVGYSLYRDGERINEKVITKSDYGAEGDVIIKPVIKGGYETVYSSQGPQTVVRDKVPSTYSLSIVPNLFTGMAKISYQVAHRGEVAVRVYDVSGRLVKSLIDDVYRPGCYTTVWDGCDDGGRRVAAGIYFVEFAADNYEKVEKIILLQ